MFEEPELATDNNGTVAVKRLYASCMDTESIEERREEPLLQLLDHLGGWPVLAGSAWNASNFRFNVQPGQ